MFTQGFEKTGGLAGSAALGVQRSVGRAAGATVGTAKGAVKGVKGALAAGKEARMAGYRSAVSGAEKSTGSTLAATRMSKMKGYGKSPAPQGMVQGMQNKAKSDVKDRAARMVESKKANKPSFAKRHPFITAGALYIGAKSALGGGDDKPQQQPQYIGPQ